MEIKKPENEGLPITQANAAGIDIGSKFHVVAVPHDRCEEPVRTFH